MNWIARMNFISTASVRSGWKAGRDGRIALAGDAAFCVSLVAGQGSALAMVSAYVLAGELAKAGGRHEEAFGKYEERLRSYVVSKQQGAERFAAAFAPKTRWGLFPAQPSDKGFRNPEVGKAGGRQGHHRHPKTSRLPLALLRGKSRAEVRVRACSGSVVSKGLPRGSPSGIWLIDKC